MLVNSDLEPGDKCWLFLRGFLSLVTITDIVDDDSCRVTYDTGIRKGESETVLADYLYRFPDDKEKLLDAIDQEIETMRMYKSMVILERKVI